MSAGKLSTTAPEPMPPRAPDRLDALLATQRPAHVGKICAVLDKPDDMRVAFEVAQQRWRNGGSSAYAAAHPVRCPRCMPACLGLPWRVSSWQSCVV